MALSSEIQAVVEETVENAKDVLGRLKDDVDAALSYSSGVVSNWGKLRTIQSEPIGKRIIAKLESHPDSVFEELLSTEERAYLENLEFVEPMRDYHYGVWHREQLRSTMDWGTVPGIVGDLAVVQAKELVFMVVDFTIGTLANTGDDVLNHFDQVSFFSVST